MPSEKGFSRITSLLKHRSALMRARDTENVERFLTSLSRDETGTTIGLARRYLVLARHPVMAWSALSFVRKYPVIRAEIPKSDFAKYQWLYDSRRPWKIRGFISSYIELPSPPQTYWQGQARDRLRTATARARREGLKVREVDPIEIDGVVSCVLKGGLKVDETESKGSHGAILVAVFDEDERAVAFCIGDQAGNVVRILSANTSQRGVARWLCFSGFVEVASARGAKFVTEEAPWHFTGGNRVFAERLGFAPGRIRSN